KMKRLLIIALLILGMFPVLRADEGMWLPLFVSRLNYVDMQKMGLHLTAEEIYSINHSSMKDAIIQFGNGCTAEVVSAEGLVLTNHHCGYGSIQSHSSVEHDYLTDGFWAMNKNEELSNPGLTAKFLVRIEDVSARVLHEITSSMTEKERSDKVHEIAKKIQDEAIKGTHYEANVKSFFNGNEYYLFVYEIFKDVRLVGAPPSSIGKFGADTDNWMWPRHTCDFSMFRIYTAPDGTPAEYSKANVPLKPKQFLPVSLNGVHKDDFAMIMGYPGTTDRYLTSYGVKLAVDQTGPTIVSIRAKKLDIMRQDMDADAAVRIKYASKYAGIANYWKFFIGQTKGLKRLDVYDQKKQIEANFTQWVNEDQGRKGKYGEALNDISQAYAELEKYNISRIYFSEAIRGMEVVAFSRNFESLYNELKNKTPDQAKVADLVKKLHETADKFFKDYNESTDRKLMAAMLEMYYKNVPADQQPAQMADIVKCCNGDFGKYAEWAFKETFLACPVMVNAFLDKPSLKTLEKDPVFSLWLAFSANNKESSDMNDKANEQLDRGNRLFVAGLREMQPDKKFYPNANSTMRLTYGQVLDYYPADAVHYDYKTTLKGVMEKEDSTNWEFVVPAKLKQLYKTKDFGPYAENGELMTCFLTNNDITGGNSGSPVINADGKLIGLAFDGNWEAMSGNIAFEPALQRTICVDIRYVMFIIDKYAGARNLVDELVPKVNQN
ncbi:MAG TPA: S46 family peptidase, partial [Bacteroidales bacterium]|nr:S46 family peptidase [Bacteroidales bacterium]